MNMGVQASVVKLIDMESSLVVAMAPSGEREMSTRSQARRLSSGDLMYNVMTIVNVLYWILEIC